MVTEIRFPKIDVNIETATVTAWLKREGEAIAIGDVLAEITTDKGLIEFEATAAGTLRRILAPENSMVPVGYIMALLGDPVDDLPDVTAENEAILRQHRESLAATPPAPAANPAPISGSVPAAGPVPAAAPASRPERAAIRATPAARRLAREKGLDLTTVQAQTGTDLITEKVIEQFLLPRSGSQKVAVGPAP